MYVAITTDPQTATAATTKITGCYWHYNYPHAYRDIPTPHIAEFQWEKAERSDLALYQIQLTQMVLYGYWSEATVITQPPGLDVDGVTTHPLLLSHWDVVEMGR